MDKLSAKTLLFHTAMDLFRRKGYEQVSIQEICRAARVTRNAFYYYFPSKDGLLSAYFENTDAFTRSLLNELLFLPDDLSKLWFVFEAHLRLLEGEGLSLCRAFIKVNMEGNGDILKHYGLSETLTIPLLANCQKSGLIQNGLAAERLVYLTTQLMAGILLSWCAENAGYKLLENAKEAFCQLLQCEGAHIVPAQAAR